eukprot:scaffold31432_cov69-Phaeocystis_antarctica.AAC.3
MNHVTERAGGDGTWFISVKSGTVCHYTCTRALSGRTALPVRQCLERRSAKDFSGCWRSQVCEVPRERVHVNLQAAAAARTEQQPHAHKLFLTDAHASQLVPSAVSARQHHEARPAKCQIAEEPELVAVFAILLAVVVVREAHLVRDLSERGPEAHEGAAQHMAVQDSLARLAARSTLSRMWPRARRGLVMRSLAMDAFVDQVLVMPRPAGLGLGLVDPLHAGMKRLAVEKEVVQRDGLAHAGAWPEGSVPASSACSDVVIC